MVKIILLLSIFVSVVMANDINIQITNIKEVNGNLKIALYNKEENFLIVDKIYQKSKIKVTSKIVQHTFKDIPNGIYAVSVYHDKNKNDKLDKNLFGMPTEKYGFSNDARGIFGPPSFEDAKFILSENKQITIKVK